MTKQHAIQIAQKYVDTLIKNGVPVERALIFGSQIKGNPHYGSDIDVGIISSKFTNRVESRLKLMHLTHQVSEEIEPHPLTPDQLDDKWDTFAQEVSKNGVELSVERTS